MTTQRMTVAAGVAVLALALDGAPGVDAAYDPLALTDPSAGKTLDLTVDDATRHREIPLRVYLPATNAAAPVVMFSHGLGGTCRGSAFLGKHWAARGYVAVFMQHPGSDDSVWRDKPAADRMPAMNKAASLQNLILRVRDVHAVLDRLEAWNTAKGHPLNGRLDPRRVGMSGHSFGAVTTQSVSGQSAFGRLSAADSRIRAALVLSPSTPRAGDPARAFGSVKIPWMLMTGTKDLAPIGHADMASRLGVYPNLPSTIDKYELVLDNAEHSVFTERALPGDREPRNPNHHRAILAISTAFWDAELRGNAEARAWLNGDGPRSVLEKADRWQCHTARHR